MIAKHINVLCVTVNGMAWEQTWEWMIERVCLDVTEKLIQRVMWEEKRNLCHGWLHCIIWMCWRVFISPTETVVMKIWFSSYSFCNIIALIFGCKWMKERTKNIYFIYSSEWRDYDAERKKKQQQENNISKKSEWNRS